MFPGDVLQTVEVSITSSPFGGTSYFDQVVAFTQTGCVTNSAGYNICLETGSFTVSNLPAGTFWINLQNATVPNGDPVYWDENSGVGCTGSGCPSQAEESGLGTIPSESFTVEGSCGYPPCPVCVSDQPQDGFKIIHDFNTAEHRRNFTPRSRCKRAILCPRW